VTGGDGAPGSALPPDPDRIFLLECRLEQLHAALDDARAEADRARARLAEAAAREAEHARRHAFLTEEMSRAREETVGLHRRLEHSEALRAELEGHLFEAGAHGDVDELVRLRKEVLAERQRAAVNERTLAYLRARVEELVASRETLHTRVAEWQRLVRHGDHDAIDLAEFIAALRRDILELEHRNQMGERREAGLREQLERTDEVASVTAARAAGAPVLEPASFAAPEAVIEPAPAAAPEAVPEAPTVAGGAAAPAPDAVPSTPEASGRSRADDLVAALAAAEDPEVQAELLLRLGRSGEVEASWAIRPWATAKEYRVRAAAYEALGRLLERDPTRLEPHVRWGLADGDPRVRRRVVLAAATARGLELRALLDPLRGDPDAQVRRVVHEVLRRAPPAGAEAATAVPSPGTLLAPAGTAEVVP
jgi:hypothetical protein